MMEEEEDISRLNPKQKHSVHYCFLHYTLNVSKDMSKTNNRNCAIKLLFLLYEN